MVKFTRILIIGSLLAILGFAAFLIKFGGDNTVSINSRAALLPSVSAQLAEMNLTDTLATTIAQKVTSSNPADMLPVNNELPVAPPKADAIITQALETQIKRFGVGAIRPSVAEENIIILRETTSANQITYLRTHAQILAKNLQKKYITSKGTPVPAEFLALSKAYKDTMNDLLVVPVPPDLIDIHIQTLELLGAQANAFALIANYEQDPLKAVLATQLQGEIAIESGELKEKMLLYIKEHTINL